MPSTTMPANFGRRLLLSVLALAGAASIVGVVFSLTRLPEAWRRVTVSHMPMGFDWTWQPPDYAELKWPLLVCLIPVAGLWIVLSGGRLFAPIRPLDSWRAATVCCAVLGIACVSRLTVVSTTDPQLSRDIDRYLIDGIATTEGLNPYALTPIEMTQVRGVPVAHDDLISIYQPTSQTVFAASTSVAQLGAQPGDERTAEQELVLRLHFVTFDLLIIALILCVLRLHGRSLWWAALYAWHPLPIVEVAASGHQDVIGIALLLCSVACVWVVSDVKFGGALSRKRRGIAAVLAGVTLAGAIGVKPIVLPIAALYVWYLRGDRRAVVTGIVATVLTLIALYLPFALMPGGLWGMIDTAVTFTRDWSFNSPIHANIHAAFDSQWFASLVGESIATPLSSKWVTNAIVWSALLVVMIVVVRRGADLWEAVIAYFLAALLLSSTVYPWYLLWALALVPIRFNLAVWVWSLTITWSYAVWLDPDPWRVPTWVMWAQYVPVFGVLVWMGVRKSRKAVKQESSKSDASVG